MPDSALISIHDVMPRTLNGVEELFQRIQNALPQAPVTLLICPGLEWTTPSLDRLHRLLDQGAIAAGHGWAHRAVDTRSLFHRLHSRILSRDAAEHLSRSREEILQLMTACFAWFGEHHLPEPDLYVPPAWALGPLKPHDLKKLPFRQIETLSGVYLGNGSRFLHLPLLGFEADNAFRASSLRLFNALNKNLPNPLRIAIHPKDHQLQLAQELQKTLREPWNPISYSALERPKKLDE